MKPMHIGKPINKKTTKTMIKIMAFASINRMSSRQVRPEKPFAFRKFPNKIYFHFCLLKMFNLHLDTHSSIFFRYVYHSIRTA